MQTMRSTDGQKTLVLFVWEAAAKSRGDCPASQYTFQSAAAPAQMLPVWLKKETDSTHLQQRSTEHTGLHTVGGVVAHNWKAGTGLRAIVPPHRRFSRWYLVSEKWGLICTPRLIINATGKHTESVTLRNPPNLLFYHQIVRVFSQFV